jgi:hypothetical protein
MAEILLCLQQFSVLEAQKFEAGYGDNEVITSCQSCWDVSGMVAVNKKSLTAKKK